jgi:hypothetical protein
LLDADLTDAEIDKICDGLTQSAAKVRFLRGLGLIVDRKPNGKPLVNRQHYDRVRGTARRGAQPVEAEEPAWTVPA